MIHRIIAALLAALLLTGCAGMPEEPSGEAETTPAATVPADGDPDDVTCRGSYSAGEEELADTANAVVASMEEAELTAAQLRIAYRLEVEQYRQSQAEIRPDFSRPLDTQPCPLDTGVKSWQQYFLREALNGWHSRQALIRMAAEVGVPTEEAYAPDPALYEEYMPEVPALNYLYGYEKSYRPNSVHQDYLDSLPQVLQTLARESGLADADALAEAIAGPGADGQDLLRYAEDLNLAYMYFVERGYHFETASGGDGEGERTVSLRHILVIPPNAQVAEDGTVTCSDEDWDAGLVQARDILKTWEKEVRGTRFAAWTGGDAQEARFAEVAREYSADAGSACNGGLYADLRAGQLAQELEDWCFREDRQRGDVEILRSECGWHILFFSGSGSTAEAEAQREQAARQYADLIREAREAYPMSVNYGAIRLPESSGSSLTADELLYPDVAHERFTEVPLYIQQDYGDTAYSDYTIYSHGCGICVLAMAGTYLTDTEITPPELAARYGYYCGPNGSETILIDDPPAEMGFYVQTRSHNWDLIDQALANGQPVASLQVGGYWTGSGHYILISGITEDGRYVVRDSNLPNYSDISAFAEDCHSRRSLTANGMFFWIFSEKVIVTPACARCGTESEQRHPQALLRQAYHCEKCLAAMARREAYLLSEAG